MGTSRSVTQFSQKITHVGTTIDRRQKAAVQLGAQAAKNIIETQAASQGLSPTAKLAGKPWGVRYSIVEGPTGPHAVLGFRGPFHLVERDTEPHEIGVRKRARKGNRKKKALAFNGIVVASVMHPGTKGKRIFRNARKKIDVIVPRVMSGDIVYACRAVLK